MSRDPPCTVLIVDDGPEDRALARRLLLTGAERLWRFEEADTVGAAIARLARTDRALPDCVLLDHGLPDGDALDVLSAIADADGLAACPVVVLTGIDRRELGTRVLRAGAQDYVCKDALAPGSLARAVENAIDRWSMARELRDGRRALRDSEERYRLLADALPHLTWVLDAQDGLVYANPRVAELTGVDAPELARLGWRSLVHPEDLARLAAEIARPRVEGRAHEVEYRLRTRDGSYRWTLSRAVPMRDAGGRVTHWIGTTTDIHARRASEQAAQRRAENLRRLAAAGSRLLADDDAAALAEAVFDEVGAHVGADYCFFARVLPGTDPPMLAMVASRNLDPALRAASERLPFGQGLCGRAAQTRRPCYVPELQGLHSGVDDRLRAAGLRVGLSIPMIAGGRLLGTCTFGSRMRTRFEPDELDLLNAACQQLAIALARCDATAERAASERRLRLTLQATGTGLWTWDVEAGTVEWTAVGPESEGVPAQGAGPLAQYLSRVHADDRERVELGLQAAARGRGLFEDEFRMRLDGRDEVWVVARGRVGLDAPGGRPTMLGTITDVSARRRAETELSDSQARLTYVLEAARVGTWEVDLRTGAVVCSAQTRRTFGVPDDVPLERWSQVEGRIHPSDLALHEAALARSLATGVEYEVEYRVDVGEGRLRWLLSRGRCDRDADGRPARISGVVLDIDGRRRAEEALREADRRKDEFLAMLAHELRNPLAPVRTGVRLLRAGSTDAAGVLDMVDRQVAHMVRLIDDLLDVSRVSRGRIELRREPLRLDAVVSAAVEASRPLIAERGHRLSLRQPDEPVWVSGDPVRLAQVLTNLLNNAAKYTPDGGRIALRIDAHDHSVEIRVRDDGRGIPRDQIPQAFELFAQLPGDDACASGGLGIGLPLSRRLVELHGGTLDGESEGAGRGSVFTVSLPRLVAPRPSPEQGADAAPGPRSQAAGGATTATAATADATPADATTAAVEATTAAVGATPAAVDMTSVAVGATPAAADATPAAVDATAVAFGPAPARATASRTATERPPPAA